MTEEEYQQFEHEAYLYLKARQDALMTECDLGNHEWWNYDQETGKLVFSNSGVPAVVADFQVVGSISNKTNTWLWSWANPSILESVKRDIYAVRQFGEEHKLLELTTEKWAADENDAWGMTAIAAMILNAVGAYRCPDENGALYVVFTTIHLPMH